MYAFYFFKTERFLCGLPGADPLCLTKPIFTSSGMSVNKTADIGAISGHTVCSKSRHLLSPVWSVGF